MAAGLRKSGHDLAVDGQRAVVGQFEDGVFTHAVGVAEAEVDSNIRIHHGVHDLGHRAEHRLLGGE